MQDELEAELEELEGVELEEQLLQPSTTAPAGRQSTHRPSCHNTRTQARKINLFIAG